MSAPSLQQAKDVLWGRGGGFKTVDYCRYHSGLTEPECVRAFFFQDMDLTRSLGDLYIKC